MQEHTIENLFSLAITQQSRSTKIHMQLLNNRVNTSDIPLVVDLLNQHLPNVLLTQCFNEEDLPFDVEVKNTEIGHLFEHILLEYLCQLKIGKGSVNASYSGRTSWNWVRDPMGTFHIRLSCGIKDADILPLAVEKTISLMKVLLQEDLPIADTLTIREDGETTLTFKESATYLSAENGLKNGKKSNS